MTRGRRGRLPADLPLRLSPGERCGAVAARDVRPGRQGAAEGTTSSTRTRSSTASTNSACCSTATRKNAYWYGSQLSIEETRDLAPYQNATGLQVTSAVLAGMVWALENPEAGIVETDEMDYRRCLEVQLPYLGPVKGYYTDWTPLDRPARAVPRGHRRKRSVAVQERAGAVAAQRTQPIRTTRMMTATATPAMISDAVARFGLAEAVFALAGRAGIDPAFLDRSGLGWRGGITDRAVRAFLGLLDNSFDLVLSTVVRWRHGCSSPSRYRQVADPV